MKRVLLIDTITSQQDELCWRESCQAAVQGVGWDKLSAQKRMPVPPHLQSLFEAATVKHSKAEQKAINQLLNSFQDVFSKNEYGLGKAHLVDHHIETGDAAPVKYPPRHIPLAFADEDCKELEKLKKRGVIQPSTSPWAATWL